MIDVIASEPHFAQHAVPVWRALGAHRGDAVGIGPWPVGVTPGPGDPSRPVLAAGIGDVGRAVKAGYTRIALMEHGIGQSYAGLPRERSASRPNYAGGGGHRAHVGLFLHPNEHAAGRDREAYPDATVAVVGAPILDTLPAHEPSPGRPVVAVAWHWDSYVCPETRSGFRVFRGGVVALRERYRVIGHGHPRIMGALAPWYRRAGIESVASFDEVCRRADVLVADNTSAMYAFASTGRPVVVCSPPWYRRHVEHGLRFWSAAGVGVACAQPNRMADAVTEALEDAPGQQAAREAALDVVYAYRTGAAERAALALMEWSRVGTRELVAA